MHPDKMEKRERWWEGGGVGWMQRWRRKTSFTSSSKTWMTRACVIAGKNGWPDQGRLHTSPETATFCFFSDHEAAHFAWDSYFLLLFSQLGVFSHICSSLLWTKRDLLLHRCTAEMCCYEHNSFLVHQADKHMLPIEGNTFRTKYHLSQYSIVRSMLRFSHPQGGRNGILHWLLTCRRLSLWYSKSFCLLLIMKTMPWTPYWIGDGWQSSSTNWNRSCNHCEHELPVKWSKIWSWARPIARILGGGLFSC